MGLSRINANVAHHPPEDAYASFRRRVSARRRRIYARAADFLAAYRMSRNTYYARCRDPDLFTVGELRELRHTLHMSKDELIQWIRDIM